MPVDTRQSTQIPAASLTPLDQEARAYLPTAEAAAHLNRRPQTLRQWAMTETGLVRPRRIGVRLMWPVADIRRVLEVA
jgi:hypothetical protein